MGLPAPAAEITLSYRHPVTGLPTPPLDWQREFHESPAKFRMPYGGVRSGKTLGASLEIIRWCLQYPGSAYLIGRWEYSALRDTTMVTFFEEAMPPELRSQVRFTASSRIALFPNRSRVYFTHMQNPLRFRSLNLSGFWIDECTEGYCDQAWPELTERLSNPIGERRAILTTNPAGEDCFWWRLFNGARLRGDKRYWMHQVRSTENKYLSSDYLEGLMHMDAERFERQVIGRFTKAQGAILPQYDPSVHDVPDFAIPEEWTRIRAIDPGIDHPLACLWIAQDPETGKAYVYREWIMGGLGLEEQCLRILSLSVQEKITFTVVDPAARQRQLSAQGGRSLQRQFADHGLPCIIGNNDVAASIGLLQTRLSRSFDLGKREVLDPSLFFFESCPITRAQVGSWRYEEKQGVSTGKPAKSRGKDDAIAALRYGMMALPHVDRPEAVTVEPEKTAAQRCRQQAEEAWLNQRQPYSFGPAYGYYGGPS